MPTKTINQGSFYIFNATKAEYDNGSAGVSSTVITYPDILVEIHSSKIEVSCLA